MKEPNVEYVRNSGQFRLVKELGFNEILNFVLENIVIRNVFTIIYLVYNLLFFYLLIVQIVSGIVETGFTFNTFGLLFPGITWGAVAGSFLIIPFHEGLHALAFLLIGARKIRFGADLKQMIFYATAANFVAGRKGFTLVALTPFIIINLSSIPLMFTGDLEIRLFITVMLLFHNVMCIGDFGMLSFFNRHKDKEMVTFDDLDTKTAFFYEKIKD